MDVFQSSDSTSAPRPPQLSAVNPSLPSPSLRINPSISSCLFEAPLQVHLLKGPDSLAASSKEKADAILLSHKKGVCTSEHIRRPSPRFRDASRYHEHNFLVSAETPFSLLRAGPVHRARTVTQLAPTRGTFAQGTPNARGERGVRGSTHRAAGATALRSTREDPSALSRATRALESSDIPAFPAPLPSRAASGVAGVGG